MKKTLGGDRLGSGNRMKVELHGYERSTHDLGYILRTTMSSGTLVPFLKEVALPGDTFDINLDCDIKTHPTIGPLFGSYKVQLDIFEAPLRLYQGQLHNNKLGIGLNMSDVKLPTISLLAVPIAPTAVTGIDIDNAQINPSSIFSYLGMRGVIMTEETNYYREFNAIPFLAYWDIYKNYYSNKQEEIGAVIHSEPIAAIQNVTGITVDTVALAQSPTVSNRPLNQGSQIVVTASAAQDLNQIYINTSIGLRVLTDIAVLINTAGFVYTLAYRWEVFGNQLAVNWEYQQDTTPVSLPIQVVTFPLAGIDNMREKILAHATQTTPFDVNAALEYPYRHALRSIGTRTSMMHSQEGLAIKTYQSDVLQNWLQTEWIDGAGGINEISAIDTSTGSFTIDTLNLSRKVYDMLNRIAVSGGTYDDWLDAVYTHDRYTRCESPMYHGGLIKELVFQEVVSQSESPEGGQPLGTLAGKGIMGKKHKGGHVTIKVSEPSYVIGIISLTPRIDYSQGNDWDTHLKTMDDLHKPALDEIGFQESINEQRAWWSTNEVGGNIITTSAGKQPAWINYMTNYNKTKGNFAFANNEMFMTLNRKYTAENNGGLIQIEDLTTYIDPSKYNNIFAQTSLDSQNFWVQIAVDMIVRRKISAKIMPNL